MRTVWDKQMLRQDVLTTAEQFHWPFGKKTVFERTGWAGLRNQWMTCNTTPSQLVVILEDDTEVSPYALQWLQDASDSYAHRDDIAGSCTQRYNFSCPCFSGFSFWRPPLTVGDSSVPYLSPFHSLSAWGFSPVHSSEFEQVDE